MSNWIESTVGDVFDVVGGGTPSTEKSEYWNGSIPWITSADIDEHSRITSRKAISEKAVKDSATSKVPAGSVVVVTRVGLGKVGIAETELCFSQDCQGLLFDQKNLEPKFVAHQLIRATKRFHEVSRGTTISGVTKKQLLSTPFFVAPRGEQKRVVDKLEELLSDLEAGVVALERARTNLKRYRTAVLKAAVAGRLTEKWRAAHPDVEPAGKLLERILAERRKKWEEAQLKKYAEKKQWPPKGWKDSYSEPGRPDVEALAQLPAGWIWVRAEQVCGFITKGTTPAASLLTSASGEVPFIKVYNLTNRGVLDFSVDPTFVSRETHTGFLARSCVYPGDVLMNIVGPPLGKVSIVSEAYPEWNINQAIAIFRPVSGVDRRYLALCLLTDVVLDWAVARGKATAGQVNLTLEICRDLPIPLPPLDEQRAIADEVSRIVSIVEAQHQAIEVAGARAPRLRQSILKRAFEGKLVPQDANDEPASELLNRIRVVREAEAGKRVRVKRREARSV